VNTFINRELWRGFVFVALTGLSALLVGYTVASPASHHLRLALYAVIAVGIAMYLPPHVFIAAALLVVGVTTAFTSPVVSLVGPALYVSDLAVLVVFFRGIVPRARRRATHALAGTPQMLFLVWMFVLAVASVRGLIAGIPRDSVIRSDLALFYWPLLYVGFTRVLAEIGLNTRLLWRNLAVVAVGFAVYALIARALNHPFHDTGLALVPTGPNETVPRNFGFASAFTIYPPLALAALAALAASRRDRFRWTIVASIGVIATLTTLVRGAIIGLALGIVVVLWLSRPQWSPTGRVGAAVRLSLCVGLAALAVLAIDPKLGDAVVQRTLPFTHQAAAAHETADYRLKAITTGIHEGSAHPAGLGVVDAPALIRHGIDPGYLAHSGFATLLIFGGWVALAVSFLTLIAVVRRSFLSPSASKWLHPAFVGTITMLAAYSLGAAGLAGDAWVIPLGALAVAIRFGLDPGTR
jgi:hypothetical protein